MTTTQINGMGFAPVSGSRQAGVRKETSDNGFAAMMSESVSKQSEKFTASRTADSGKEVARPQETKGTEKVESKPKEMDAKEIAKMPEDEAGVSEEVLEKVTEVVEKVKALAQEVLNMDEAELTALMEQLGVTMVDLLNPQVLQQLVVKAAGGSDFSVLLMDENAGMNLQQLLTGVQEIFAEAGLNQEEILPMLQNADFAQMLEKFGEQKQMEGIVAEVEAGSEMAANLEVSEETTVVEENTVSDEQTETTFQFEAVRESAGAGEREASADTSEQNSQMFTNQAEQFMTQLSHAAETSFTESLTPAEQIRDIANQILEKVRVMIQPDQTSMEITLNPESLGKVNLNIVSKQGIMTAQFTTQTEAARMAIESQMTVLRENLQNQGLKVEAIEVSVSDFAFQQQQENLNNTDTSGQNQNQNGRSARRSLTLEEALSFDDVTEEESITLDMMARNGNQVDFTA